MVVPTPKQVRTAKIEADMSRLDFDQVYRYHELMSYSKLDHDEAIFLVHSPLDEKRYISLRKSGASLSDIQKLIEDLNLRDNPIDIQIDECLYAMAHDDLTLDEGIELCLRDEYDSEYSIETTILYIKRWRSRMQRSVNEMTYVVTDYNTDHELRCGYCYMASHYSDEMTCLEMRLSWLTNKIKFGIRQTAPLAKITPAIRQDHTPLIVSGVFQ